MSLFERIQNKILIEQSTGSTGEQKKKQQRRKGADFSDTSSRTGGMKGGSNDPIKQKAEAEYIKYTDDLARKRGITGKNPGKKLEKEVDIGLKKQDGTIGKRTPSKGYAQGEPFQGNTNVKDPTGRYPASGRSTLKGRQRYQFDVAKTSRKDAAKARLVTRIQKVEDPFFADKSGRQDVKKITKYVDDITKNQKLSKATGKKSTLFKTLKAYTDAKNPTIKGASGGKIPMPEGPKRDAQIKKNLKALDDKIARQAKLPKGTYIPKGGVFPKSTFPTDVKGKPQILKGIKDKKTGKIIPPKNVKVSDKLSVPFEPKETNIQFKSDKLDLDYGKRFAQRDGLTAAERKRKLQKLKRDLNIKNPTITSPVTGGQIPATATNLKKYNLPPLKKTRVKAPNYDELKRKNKKIVKKMKNIVKSKPSTSGLYDPFKTKIPVLPKTTPIVTPPKLDPITQPLTDPLKKTRTLKKIKIKAPPKTGTFKKIMKFAGKNRNPILKGLAYTAGGAYLLSRLGKTDNAPKNNKSLIGGTSNYITKVKPVDATFTLAGKGGDGYRPAGMKK